MKSLIEANTIPGAPDRSAFSPPQSNSLETLDIPLSLIEDMVLRRLYTTGTSTIGDLCSAIKLSFKVIHEIFQQLRQKQLVIVTGMSGNDYQFTLSDAGGDLALSRFNKSQYSGPAPVSIKSYDAAVRAQTAEIELNRELLKEALSDLVLTEKFLDELGPAIISQSSLFLYGPSGNGKTSIAERLQRTYKDLVLIPYAVSSDGQIIVVYDPAVHEKVETNCEGIDPRWVLCRRPCVTVGGELELNMLDLQLDEGSGVYAAPIQMKANNGILIIDDLGRQRISPKALLNRWIVPLDRRVDYLTLRYGSKFQIPFEMIVVFATNLNPAQLSDEAFLRRIKNKVYVEPVEAEAFDEIFKRSVSARRLSYIPGSATFFRKLCINSANGGLRACYPSDIVELVISTSMYDGRPARVDRNSLERASSIYFTKPVLFDAIDG